MGKKPLQNMMMYYNIYNVSFLNFIAPNSFWKFKTILHTVAFHTRDWEMSKTQREWFTPAAAPLQWSYRVVAVSKKYQHLKKGDGYVIAARYTCISEPNHQSNINLVKWICFWCNALPPPTEPSQKQINYAI